MNEHEDRLVSLKQEYEDLKATLEAKGKEVSDAENHVASSAGATATQRGVATTALEAADKAVSIVPDDISSDDNDLYILADVDQIRLSALEAVHGLLYPMYKKFSCSLSLLL